MENYQKKLFQIEKNPLRANLILFLEAAMVGVLVGLTICLYRLCLTKAETILFWVVEQVKGNALYIALWFLILIILGCTVGWLIRFEPLAAGSGIAQVSREINSNLEASWWRVLLAKFVGAVLCILGGLSLGRAGPSIQMGAMTAKGFSRIRKVDKEKEIYFISCGAGAGLAATFHAPIAGIVLILEELHHGFNRTLALACMTATITADFVSKLFWGQETIFSFASAKLPIQQYWLLLILGVLLGIAGGLYQILLKKGERIWASFHRIPKEVRMSIVFVLAGVIGLFLPQVLGGGQAMVKVIMGNAPTWGILLMLVVVKYIFSIFSSSSGAPGGLFFPVFIIGSYLGGIFGYFAIHSFSVSPDLWQQFIILGMAGFLVAVVRTPVTGIILVVEMTGGMSGLLDITIVCLLAYVVSYLLEDEPLYRKRVRKKHKKRKSRT